LRSLPKTDRVLQEPQIAALVEHHGRAPVVTAIRAATEALRGQLLAGNGTVPIPDDLSAWVCREATRLLAAAERRTLRPAINATGVVLHTGLGRAVLSAAAAEAVAEVARGHSLLEVDPESGERGSRLDHIAPLLRELTGAEDALVVNNNAAAVFLAIGALAAGREVVIARGQLVEIGGSFRIPDVIRSAGARLVEVGTTNKVRLSDYAEAITPETALLLRVHPSNFRIVGFTEEPSLEALSALGRERGVPVLDDLGSGALVDLSRHGLVAEPTVHASVAAGADVITFSGDKLLGGPQAGLVIGRAEILSRLKRHPLMRVLRVDKLTVAALEATLRLYRDEPSALRAIPTLAALTASAETLQARAEQLAERLQALDIALEVTLEAGISQVGGGSLPGEELPTTLVSIRAREIGVTELAQRLRIGEPSVWGRIRRDRLLFDPRTVTEAEVDLLADCVAQALRRLDSDEEGSR
jgi:L-seryl-tRNA(Ser) seleniumtransferase